MVPNLALTETQKDFLTRAMSTEVLERPIDKPRCDSLEHITVHPTRGILAELSAYICEACWDQQKNLMRDNPNLTALIFVRTLQSSENVGNGLNRVKETKEGAAAVAKQFKELVGACMLLRVMSMAGEEVFIIRGLNPLKRFLAQVSAESFFEELIDNAIMPYAKASGVKFIVCPFDGDVKSHTNVSKLREYLEAHYGHSPIMPIDQNGPSSEFNGRKVWDKCRVIRAL